MCTLSIDYGSSVSTKGSVDNIQLKLKLEDKGYSSILGESFGVVVLVGEMLECLNNIDDEIKILKIPKS